MKKTFFQKLFSNNIFLLVISVLISIIIWVAINANSTAESVVTMTDIPVKIELSEDVQADGLSVFTSSNPVASVDVSANRVTAGSLTAQDLSVYANTSMITAPGTYNLDLNVKKSGDKTNFNIVPSTLSPRTVTVYADKLKKKTLNIDNQLVIEVPEGKYANTTLSDSKITITGPEVEVGEIQTAALQGTIQKNQMNGQKIQKKIIFIDKYGNTIDTIYSKSDIETVTVSVSMLESKEINLSVDTVNNPEKYPAISIIPKNISIAAPKEVLSKIGDKPVEIGTLDFSSLKNKKNTIKFDITLPEQCKNLSTYTTAKAEIDLSSYKESEFEVDIEDTVDQGEYFTEYTDESITVKIIGPESSLSKLNASNIRAIADFSGKLNNIVKPASLDVPIKIHVSDPYCFAIGTYNATVHVTPNK